MKWKIPLFRIYWDQKDIDSIIKVINRGTYWTTGPEINQLEKDLAEYIGANYAVAFNSGTSALHANLLALDITKGEVIVPSFTFISTANSVVLAGAKPVFAEIEDETYGLSLEDVKERISSKTRAIMPVHFGGGPCKGIKGLSEIAEDNDIFLIEDAAESFGAIIDNKKVGTFGDSSMFSFCQNKIITGGEGGVILANSKKIYDKLKLIRSHGRREREENYFSTNKEFDYIEIGFNFRMSSITAALVLSQLKKIDKIIELRNKKAQYYDEGLSDIRGIKIPYKSGNFFHVYQMYTIEFEDNNTREKVKRQLEKSGIMSRVYFQPIHLKIFYKKYFGYKVGDLPLTEEISKKVLTLPLYPTLPDMYIDYIIRIIKTCLK
jgi:dTDP-4-amino-4,6-dideoxygalactose transaminase